MSEIVLSDEQIEQLRAVWNDPNGHLAMEWSEKQVSPWQPIESAAEDGTPKLLFARLETAEAPVICVGWYDPELGAWIAAAFSPNRSLRVVPTHWMTLPPFPGADPGIPIYATSPGGNLQAPE